MILTEEQLNYIVDKHVQQVLKESGWGNLGTIVKGAAKGLVNAGRSEFVRNIGNTIGNGIGDDINKIFNGEWKNISPLNKDYDSWCKTYGRNPKILYRADKFISVMKPQGEAKTLVAPFLAYCQKNKVMPNNIAYQHWYQNIYKRKK